MGRGDWAIQNDCSGEVPVGFGPPLPPSLRASSHSTSLWNKHVSTFLFLVLWGNIAWPREQLIGDQGGRVGGGRPAMPGLKRLSLGLGLGLEVRVSVRVRA